MKQSKYSEPQILAIYARLRVVCRWRSLPGARHEQRVILQVAGETWRDGCVDDLADVNGGGKMCQMAAQKCTSRVD